ncbi:MAG TPA: ATP-dependent DNA helicase UvrD2 [Acidimicrobiales bacterium]|jgi:DNA helicase-2/ATP-dependent DNA helicase PcrA|nr:ATP-dependent DNA helicase UvrD2 [Acidimicrobiales bacterium]
MDDGLLAGLDDEQRLAVTSTAQPLCIVAGAGSGKTRVLTRRIAHRVQTDDADPRRILALTFTRKAAGELTDRLDRLGLRDHPTAGTFHAAAYAQLRSHWAGGDRRPPTLLDRKVPVLGRLVRRGGALTPAELAAEIEWAKVRLVSPAGYEEAAHAAGRRSSVGLSVVARLYQRYEDDKRAKGLVDFDDLLIHCLAAMRRDPSFRDAQRWRFRHLFVDEFQDVNPLQFQLLQAWLGDSPDLCVVGDPAQAIYRWNGADADYLLRFASYFPSAEVVVLGSNYRSSPQILQVAARVLGRAAGVDRPPLTAHRPDGPDPDVEAHPTDVDEAAAVARRARDHHGPGRRWSSQAVLVRTNAQLPVLETAFRQANIPYRVRGGRAFIDRPEVRDALQAARQANSLFSIWLADLESALSASKEQLPEMATEVATERHTDRVAGLDELVRLGHEFAALDPVAPAHAFPQWLAATVRGEARDGGDAVELATFHAAKGLEWSVVHLAGIEAGLVPITHARDDEAVAEERRLLYVAVTRAGEAVHATWAAARTFGEREVSRQPSPWLHLLRRPSSDGGPAPTRTADPRRARAAIHASRRALGDAADQQPSQLRLDDPPQVRRAFDALWQWRSQEARRGAVPAAVVLPDKVLHELAQRAPTTADDLALVDGLGPLLVSRYGSTLLAVLRAAKGEP